MTDQYGNSWKKKPCPICGKEICISGLAWGSHARTHQKKYASIFLSEKRPKGTLAILGGRKSITFMELDDGMHISPSNGLNITIQETRELHKWLEKVISIWDAE
jgi:hypothetical protein